MNTIKKHVPGFVDGVEPVVAEFNNTADLLEIPFVKIFSEDETFHRYSIKRRTGDALLMAEYDNGDRWYVVGYIRDGDAVDLPAFQNS